MENSSRDGNTRPPDLPPEKSVCRSRSNQTWNNGLVQNWERSMSRLYIKVTIYILSPAYLTYTQNTSGKMSGWMKHELESRFPGEIPITSDTQMTPPLWQKAKKN